MAKKKTTAFEELQIEMITESCKALGASAKDTSAILKKTKLIKA
ncbi:hypothetical protein FACS1894166_07570 [Bacilli bacterium]|nr:hypothetical protein FACS1894166_07570 [Bacilli bacterium]